MSVLVTENLQEDFYKPPPKKKWLQNYIEEDTLGNNLREETQQFVKLLGRQNSSKEGLRQWKAANTPHKFTLSQNVIGGVVQGVIDQFSNYFENDTSSNEDNAKDETEDAPSKEEKLSQSEITPVVQSVISQFLNGSLSDSGFRRSRKRSHKHVNSRHKEKSGSGYSESASCRSSSVIKYVLSSPDNNEKPPIKIRKFETLMGSTEENNEALNLTRSNSKVTFAKEDKCYSADSTKSLQKSKSQKMYSMDYSKRRILENYQLIVNNDIDQDGPLDLADKGKSQKIGALNANFPGVNSGVLVNPVPVPMYSERVDFDKRYNYSSVSPASTNSGVPRAQDLSLASSSSRILEAKPYSVIKPKAIKPAIEAIPKVFSDFYPATQGHSIFTQNTALKLVQQKPKVQPPTAECHSPEVFKQKTSTREVHNRLEKNRRAHLKSCFNELAVECELDPSKASNVLVIRTAYKCIMALRREEREHERKMAALVQEKIIRQNRLNELKRECAGLYPDSDCE